MKLNELVCPACGLKCITDDVQTTCDSCQTQFTAAQSRRQPALSPYPVIVPQPFPGYPIYPTPYITWIGTGTDSGGNATISGISNENGGVEVEVWS